MPTDLILGLLKDAVSRRRDLKVVIMSATLNAGKFQAYFPDAFRLEIPGRAYPVRVYHLRNATPNYNACALHLVKYIHENMPAGDILVFLTTVVEVERATELLREALKDLEVIPLHATLPVDEQQKAFQQSSNRRCIVSTNVAETSITIDGVVYVIGMLASDFRFVMLLTLFRHRPCYKVHLQPTRGPQTPGHRANLKGIRPPACRSCWTDSSRHLLPTLREEVL